METTKRKLAVINWFLASKSPWRILLANSCSSLALSKGTRPISFKYSLTLSLTLTSLVSNDSKLSTSIDADSFSSSLISSSSISVGSKSSRLEFSNSSSEISKSSKSCSSLPSPLIS